MHLGGTMRALAQLTKEILTTVYLHAHSNWIANFWLAPKTEFMISRIIKL